MITLVPVLEPNKFETHIRSGVDVGLSGLSDAALMYGGLPGIRASSSIERLRRRQEAFAVWIVLIIAVAVVLTVGIMAYVALVCIRRGGSYAGGLSIRTNGWKVWQYRMQFSCTR